MVDELKFVKPRISLRDVFRSTPQSRKDYVRGVQRHNLELRMLAEQRKLDAQAQAELMRKYDDKIKAYQKAASTPIHYTYSPQIYVEPTPEPAPSRTSSSSPISRSGTTVSSLTGLPSTPSRTSSSRTSSSRTSSSSSISAVAGAKGSTSTINRILGTSISTPAQRQSAASRFFK